MILQQIQNNLTTCDKQHLAKHLGYNSIQKANKAFDALLNVKSLYIWYTQGFYDFKYTAETLIEKLVEYFQLDVTLLNKELKKYQLHKVIEAKLQGSYIFANTNFKRRNESIFSLSAQASKRWIEIREIFEESLYKMELEELEVFYSQPISYFLNIISDIIQKHYQNHIDSLGIWGKIVNYKVHLFGDDYIFNTDGNIIECEEVIESFS